MANTVTAEVRVWGEGYTRRPKIVWFGFPIEQAHSKYWGVRVDKDLHLCAREAGYKPTGNYRIEIHHRTPKEVYGTKVSNISV